MLAWLEGTGIARWVQESMWGYPITLVAHAVGMAILVGITAIIALRLLGVASAIPIGSLRQMTPYWVFGLVLNAISGAALFVADATRLFSSLPFQIKIAAIIVGGIIYWWINVAILRPATLAEQRGENFAPTASQRYSALLVLLIWWVAVILSGRLIAYIDN